MATYLRSFPTPVTRLSKILNDAEFKHSFLANLKIYNPLIVALYRSGILPLFGWSRTVMLLTTKGRKSGKLRYTPIGYFRIGGVIHLFSAWGKGASWYKNMIDSPQDVWIQIGTRRWPVRAEMVTDSGDIYQVLAQFVQESPAGARYLLGWDPDHDQMDYADFSPIMERVLIIRFVEKKA
jgi:deazaflavin-dependent oxidoreductase (nitroreductase family)